MNRLLITGFAYSGSTLLSWGLSRSPYVCALGEVPMAPLRSPDLPCTCGVSFAACPIWGPIFAERSVTLVSLSALIPRLDQRLLCHEPAVRWWLDSGKTQHEGLPAHLDVSLARGHGRSGELRVVHLVRHPAAVAYSCLWRGMTLEEAVALWLEQEQRAYEAFDRAGLPVLSLRFEEMVADFGATLSRLGAWLEVTGPFGETHEPWQWQRCPWTGRAHMMGSNPTVKFGGRPPTVAADERYRAALTPACIAEIEERAAHLLARLGAPT